MINKNKVRKIILEEILKNIKRKQALKEGVIIPVTAGLVIGGAAIAAVSSFIDDPMGAKVDRVTTHTPANNVYLVMEQMINSVANAQVISRTDARKLARELEAATLEYTVALVPATDEDAIKDIIERSGSKINFAIVCVEFEAITGKSFKDVYRDELSGGGEIMGTGYLRDQRTYVINPIMDLPFIILNVNGTPTPLTEQEFLDELKKAKAAPTPGGPGGPCSPPVSYAAPFMTNAAKVMNAYATRESISGWPSSGVTEGEAWDSTHTTNWPLFVQHVFANVSTFTPHAAALTTAGGPKYPWKKLSKELRAAGFPNYTYNKPGFLAFCLDAFCDDDSHGKQTPSSGGSGGGGGSTPVPAPVTPDDGQDIGAGGDLMSMVNITLNQTGTNFTNSGFTHPNGNPDELVAKSILNFADQESLRTGMDAVSLNFYMEVDGAGTKVVDVEVVRGDSHMGDFKRKVQKINRGVLDVAKGMDFPGSGAYTGDSFDSGRSRRQARGGSKYIRATITFKAGRYLGLI